MRRHIRPRLRPGSLLLLSLLTGCTYWKNEPPVGAAAVLTEARPRNVRVTTADGSRLELRNARIVHDTLTGLGEHRDTMRVAVSDVKQLELRTHDQYRSILLVAALVGMMMVGAESYDLDFGY